MKKIKLALALLPLVAITSCNKTNDFWYSDRRIIEILTPVSYRFENSAEHILYYRLKDSCCIEIKQDRKRYNFYNVSYVLIEG